MSAYEYAKSAYAKYGVDTEAAIETLKNVTVAMHCWQGDDVTGFDNKEALSGGIQTTGNYPGKARCPEELMADMEQMENSIMLNQVTGSINISEDSVSVGVSSAQEDVIGSISAMGCKRERNKCTDRLRRWQLYGNILCD